MFTPLSSGAFALVKHRVTGHARGCFGVALKCLSHEKSTRGKILKYRQHHKKSFHYRIAPPRNLPRSKIYRKKIRPARAAAERIFAGKLSAGGNFSGGGRSYNGTPAVTSEDNTRLESLSFRTLRYIADKYRPPCTPATGPRPSSFFSITSGFQVP